MTFIVKESDMSLLMVDYELISVVLHLWLKVRYVPDNDRLWTNFCCSTSVTYIVKESDMSLLMIDYELICVVLNLWLYFMKESSIWLCYKVYFIEHIEQSYFLSIFSVHLGYDQLLPEIPGWHISELVID